MNKDGNPIKEMSVPSTSVMKIFPVLEITNVTPQKLGTPQKTEHRHEKARNSLSALYFWKTHIYLAFCQNKISLVCGGEISLGV